MNSLALMRKELDILLQVGWFVRWLTGWLVGWLVLFIRFAGYLNCWLVGQIAQCTWVDWINGFFMFGGSGGWLVGWLIC